MATNHKRWNVNDLHDIFIPLGYTLDVSTNNDDEVERRVRNAKGEVVFRTTNHEAIRAWAHAADHLINQPHTAAKRKRVKKTDTAGDVIDLMAALKKSLNIP